MIYVNARFLTQKITGVQRFSIEISKKLKEKIPNIVFISPKNIIHHDLAQQLDVRIIGNTQGHLWEQVSLPVFLLTQKKPLLINLANTAPIFYKNKISTIHDIAVERFPENFSFLFKKYYQFIIPTILENSKLIFTVSEFSKSEISEHFNINKNKIDVIYNAVNSEFKKQKPLKKTISNTYYAFLL